VYTGFTAGDPLAAGGFTYQFQATCFNALLSVADPAHFASLPSLTLTGNGTNTITVNGNLADLQQFLADGLRFSPDPYFSGEAAASATLQSSDNRQATAGGVVPVRPVAATLVPRPAGGVGGAPGATVPFPILLPSDPDQDGSENVSVSVIGLPADATLSAGTLQADGSWLLAPFELPGLTITLPAAPTAFPVTVRADVSDFASYGSADTNETVTTTASATLTVTVAGVPPGVVPAVSGPASADTTEGVPAVFSQAAGTAFTLANPSPDPTAVYTVYVRTDGGTIDVAAAPGVTATSLPDGRVSLSGTFAALNSALAAGFTVTAPRYFSGPITVGVDAVAPDGLSGSADVPLAVHPVAAPADGYVPPAIYSNALGPVPFPIRFAATPDADGSETQYVLISGLPSGASLNAGYGNRFTGVWTVPRDQLPGLTVTLTLAPFGPPPVITVTLVNEDFADFGGGGSEGPASFGPQAGETVQATAAFTTELVVLAGGTPTVTAPPDQSVPEGTAVTFRGDLGTAFAVGSPQPTTVYQITLTTTDGTLALGAGVPATVTVSGDGTNAITLTGLASDLATVFTTAGFTYTPTAFRSGETTVTLRITDPLDSTGFSTNIGFTRVRLAPVASAPAIAASALPGVVPAAPVAVPAGTFTVSPWPDTDGSETCRLTIRIAGVADPSQFVLTAGGLPLTPTGNPGEWVTPATTDPAQLQAVLDSLVLVPPPGFSGRLTLAVDLTIDDAATFPSTGALATDSRTATASLVVRFFNARATVAVGPAAGREGAAADLAGVVTVSDPEFLPGDAVTLDLSAAGGRLTANNLPAGLTASGAGGALTLTGDLATLAAYLAGSGLTFTPDDPHFAGTVTLLASFRNTLAGSAASTSGTLTLAPVASPLDPTAGDATTDPATAVLLPIAVPADPDADGSETVTVFIDGVPAGATLSAGTDLGGGRWRLTTAQLAGLTFTPPPRFAGPISLTVRVQVTDRAGTLSDLYNSAAATLTVTVRLPAVTLTPDAVTVPEGTPTGTVVGRLAAAGGFAGETFTFARLGGGGGLDYTVDPDGTVHVGSQVPDFETLAGFDLSYQAIGSFGTRASGVLHVGITNVNERPAVAVPGTVTTGAGTPVPVPGVSVSDPDGAGAVLTLTLSVGRGTLFVAPAAGVVIAGEDTGNLVLTGTAAAINAAVAGLVYTPADGVDGADELTATVDDGGNTGTGGPLAASATTGITVTPAITPPPVQPPIVVLSAGDAAGSEGTAFPLPITAAAGGADLTITLLGVPADMTLSAGTRDPVTGVWTLTADELDGLTVLAPQDTAGRAVTVTVVATALDPATGLTGESRQTFSLSVANVVPVVDGVPDGVDATAGQPVTVDLGEFADPGAERGWAVTIDWGDGRTELFYTATPGAIGSRTHTYAADGRYTVTVRVADDGGEGQAGFAVNVATDPPDPDVAMTDVPDDDTPDAVAPIPFDAPDNELPDAPQQPSGSGDGDDREQETEEQTARSFGGVSLALGDNRGDGGPVMNLPTSSVPAALSPGQVYGRAAAEARSFGVERERHPLPPVLPLDQTLPAAAFGESGGDSISLIEQLYRQDTTAPKAGVAGQAADPDDAPEELGLADTVPDGFAAAPPAAEGEPAEPAVTPHAVWVGAAVAVGLTAGLLVRPGPPSASPPRPARHHLRTDEEFS
jgi:hypothetical protein